MFRLCCDWDDVVHTIAVPVKNGYAYCTLCFEISFVKGRTLE
jgi:hypothetical protein